MSLTAMLYLALFFGGSLLCIVRSPFYGVLVYELSYFLNPVVRWWFWELPSLRYSYLISLILIVSFVIHYKESETNLLRDVPQFKWLAGMIAIVLFASLWAFNPAENQRLTERFLKYMIFILLVYKVVDSSKKLDSCLFVYMVGVFYICWVAWTTGRIGGNRLEGIGASDGSEVNGTAALVVTAVPMLLHAVLFASKKWMKFIALVAMVFVMNGLILLNSRGAFIATIVSGVWFSYAVFREKNIRSEKNKLIIGLIGAVFLFFYLADNVFWERMNTLKDTSAETGSGTRVLYWFKTFDMLKDHPLGLGGDGYMWASQYYLPEEWLSGGLRAVHSTWFEVLSSFGFHGLIIFIGYIVSTFFMSARIKRYLTERGDQFHVLQLVALEAAFLAFLVSGTFINRFYSEPLYWLPTFIGVYANIYMIKPMRESIS